MSISDELELSLNDASRAGRAIFLVLDTAHAEDSYKRLDRQGIRYLSLFDGTAEESLIEIAPLLIEASSLDPLRQSTLIAWVEKMAFGAPMVTWIESALTIAELSANLRRFHIVGLAEGQSMLMRWYDTRILPIWLACLNATQLNAFAAGTTGWACVDRTGTVCRLYQPEDALPLPKKPAFGEPQITLTNSQFGMLVGAADLDILLTRVRSVIRDETRRVPTPSLVRFVAACQEQAVSAGLHDIGRQAQYVISALFTSGEAMNHPAFIQFMEDPPEEFDVFCDGIQMLPPSVWESGVPLWDTADSIEVATAVGEELNRG